MDRVRAQGWFKFGGVEFFKINFTKKLGEQVAWDNKTSIYLLSSACAEFIADIFLCPYEACRIRLVSQPDYAEGMVGTATKLMAENGFVNAFYSGFVPILFKQVPYTMAKFAVQGKVAESLYGATGIDPATSGVSSVLTRNERRSSIRVHGLRCFWECMHNTLPQSSLIPLLMNRAFAPSI